MSRPSVALFVTCLVDHFRPQVGFAAAKLLEQSGCEVIVPPQTCCGQPAYNGGDKKDASALARNAIVAFERFDYVIAPSASCAGMMIHHYPVLLADEPAWVERAKTLSHKTHELFSFLVNVRGMRSTGAKCGGTAAYHDSCSSLRETKTAREPRMLLESVEGLETRNIPDTEVCCGFGGLFSVKYPDVSARMADDKIAHAIATGADLMIGPDLGCLLHLAGRLSRKGQKMDVRHAAEILAGMGDEPAIGKERG
jgi:L-lactate dehydrogenase complex protein LldE